MTQHSVIRHEGIALSERMQTALVHFTREVPRLKLPRFPFLIMMHRRLCCQGKTFFQKLKARGEIARDFRRGRISGFPLHAKLRLGEVIPPPVD